MSRAFRFDDPGEGIREAEVTQVLVSVGDEVSEGDEVLIVETDKATTDLPSPYTGTVEEIHVSEGDVIEVGDAMITFSGGEEDSGGDEDEAGRQGEDSREAESRERRSGGKAAAVGELPEAEEGEEAEEGDATRPRSRRDETASAEGLGRSQRRRREQGPIPASPATRRLARKLEVDLASVEPSGSHGRVTRGDVESAAGRKRSGKGRGERERLARRRPSDGPPPAPELPDFGKWGPVERVPFRGVRRAAARQMAVSWQQIPHVTHHEEVDVTELERWRRRQNSRRGEDEAKLSLTALMFKAVAATLKRHPRFNASLDVESQEIILKHYVHIGMAIDSEDGLIVGVIREVDRKSIDELASESVELVDRVRRREVAGDELRGATFTVTNVGPLGGTAFTPVVNHPEVGILGMAQARLQQVVAGDLDEPRTDVRLMLPLSFSFDHRVNDGADAARFVSDLGEILADPDAMLMRV